MADRYEAAAYADQWPDYPELLYGHELEPNPGLRPFAPFRLYKTPVAPPYRQTPAESEYAVKQQAWGARQLHLYATGPPPRASGADSADPASAAAVGVTARIWVWLTSSAWAAWARVLWGAEPLWRAGQKTSKTVVAWVADMAKAATARIRVTYESFLAVVSVGAILLALVVAAEGLLRVVGCYVHLGDGPAQEPHYILVRDVKSWAVPQPPNCA